MILTRQLVAESCLLGMGLDALGGCYLAYELFGGNRGPLRFLARMAGYVGLFLAGYASVLGIAYALVASTGMGILLAFEYGLASAANGKPTGKVQIATFGILRGVVLGLASSALAGALFGFWFGLLVCVILSSSYLLGFAPIDDYASTAKPTVNVHKLVASSIRMVGVGIAGVIASYATLNGQPGWWMFGLKLGFAAGVVSAIVGLLSPWIEWQIDHLQDRRLGFLGLGFILLGMVFQSVQYWVVVFNVAVS